MVKAILIITGFFVVIVGGGTLLAWLLERGSGPPS